MTIPIGTILRIAGHTLLPDLQTAINIYWATLDDNAGSGPLDEEDIAVAAANWIDDMFIPNDAHIADTVVGTLAEVWTVNPVDGDLTPVADEALTWVGGNVNDALPNGVAAICSAKTTNSDVTGRKFLAGYNETAAVDNNLTGLVLTGLLAYAANWVTQWVDANDVIINPGIWSQTNLDFYPFTDTVIGNAIVGYQRRRKPGVGS